jgi:uncharacterized membrane-anchored protein YhcB (DUF1043 family)
MIVIVSLVAGLFWGWLTARRRGGTVFDRVQYALVYAILAGLAGLAATIMIARLTV